jgi:hypothetical protein
MGRRCERARVQSEGARVPSHPRTGPSHPRTGPSHPRTLAPSHPRTLAQYVVLLTLVVCTPATPALGQDVDPESGTRDSGLGIRDSGLAIQTPDERLAQRRLPAGASKT